MLSQKHMSMLKQTRTDREWLYRVLSTAERADESNIWLTPDVPLRCLIWYGDPYRDPYRYYVTKINGLLIDQAIDTTAPGVPDVSALSVMGDSFYALRHRNYHRCLGEAGYKRFFVGLCLRRIRAART